MKKQLIKILAFILLLSSVLSNGNGIALAEETGTWSIQQQVDEFGDVIPNSKPVIITPFSGTFDNTATKNEKLTGYIGEGRRDRGRRSEGGKEACTEEKGRTEKVHCGEEI